MSDIIISPKYSAKSGNDWTSDDLAAYNITVEPQDAPTFFGHPRLPEPNVTPKEVLEVAEPDGAATEDGARLLRYLHKATDPEARCIVDFAKWLFEETCQYLGRTDIFSRETIPLTVCREVKETMASITIVNDALQYLMVLQEGGSRIGGADPEPLLIAEAIAAFAMNNEIRENKLGLPPLQSGVIPGITLKGTSPTFYKIPVTVDLVTAVAEGRFPEDETVVHAYVPELPRPDRREIEGMKPLDNRRIIFSCLEAFKQFVDKI